MGALEGGIAVAFASGMGAIAVVLEELPPGARIVVPARRLHRHARAAGRARGGGQGGDRARRHRRHRRPCSRPARARTCCGSRRRRTRCSRSPSSTRLCEGAHLAGALVAVDSTLATPLLQRPLELGADIVIHSATKFIGGHSDLLMGVAVTRDSALADAPARGPAAARHHPGRARGLPRAARPAHAAGAARARRRPPRTSSRGGCRPTRASAASATRASPTTRATSARCG